MGLLSLMLVVFLLLVFLGIPISISLGFGVLVGAWSVGVSPVVIAQTAFNSLNKFAYLAIPLFILVGNLMEMGGLSRRLVNFSRRLAGKSQGSLGTITVVSSAFFAAISGSANATTAAIGGIMIPEMKKCGYGSAYAGALAASAGTLGVLIPPSVNMIIYAISAEVSIGTMFIAGVFPGIVIALFLIVASYLVCRKRGYDPGTSVKDPQPIKALLLGFKEASWAFFAPVLILGGIYGGWVTATESAATATLYCAFVGFFVYRELTIGKFILALRKTVITVGTVLLIVSFASAFSQLLTLKQIPQRLGDFVIAVSGNNLSIILLLIVLLLTITGMFLDPASQILIYTPLFLPVLIELGVDPIHFGIILIVGTMIGMITPPVGFNLFLGKSISGTTIIEISKEMVLFFLVMTAAFLVLVFFPVISTIFVPGA